MRAFLGAALASSLLACAPPLAEPAFGEPLYVWEPVSLPTPLATLPLVEHSGLPLVEVTIDGHGPYPFLVDTGAAVMACVDLELCRELALPTLDSVDNTDGSGRAVRRDRVRLKRLAFGGLVFEDVPAIAADYGWVGRAGDPRALGILGFELFAELLLTFDFPARELRIARGALPAPGRNHVVAYVLDGEGQPEVTLVVDGHELRALVDTGFPGTLFVAESLRAVLPTDGPPRRAGRLRGVNSQDRRLWAARLARPIELAGFGYPAVRIGFAERQPHGILGCALLAGHAVTLDQTTRRMLLAPEAPR